jgi:outer membrane receptor protein involved in Fe transport
VGRRGGAADRRQRDIVVRATGFYNRLTNAIGNVTLAEPLPDGAMRQRQNFGTARIAGLELDASWRPRAAWFVTVAHTFIDATVIDAPDAPDARRQATAPRIRATGRRQRVTFDEPRRAALTAQVRYLGRSSRTTSTRCRSARHARRRARRARGSARGLTAVRVGAEPASIGATSSGAPAIDTTRRAADARARALRPS